MSVIKTLDIQCDAKGCLTWGFGAAGRRVYVKDARHRARTEGWVYRNGLDYCPEHAVEKK